LATWISADRADDDIVAAITVDIANAGNRDSSVIAGGDAIEPVARDAVQPRKIEVAVSFSVRTVEIGKVGAAAEDKVGRATPGTAVGCKMRSDQDIGNSIAVDISGGRHAPARVIGSRGAIQSESAGPGQRR
jgi:hypothetical protein